MAITRSQIARQLLAEGGVPRIPFRNGGGRTDANTMSGSGYGAGSSPSNDGFGGGDDVARPTYSQQLANLQDPMDKPGTTGDTFPGLSKVTPRDVFKVSADNPMLQRSLFQRAMIQSIPGIGPAINLGEMNAFSLPQFRYSNTGGSKTRNDDDDTGDNNQIVKPMMPLVPKLPSDIEPEQSDMAEFQQRFSLPEQFRLADGGEVRQEYGLGSLVKKITKPIKKIVKSDVGKAALAGAALYYGGGGNLFGLQRAGMSGFSLGNLPGAGFFTSKGLAPNALGGKTPGIKAFLQRAIGKIPGGKVTAGIAGASLLGGLAAGGEEEEDIDSLAGKISDETGIDVQQIRKEVQDAYAKGDISSLASKYPFLVRKESAMADGGIARLGYANGETVLDISDVNLDSKMKAAQELSKETGMPIEKALEKIMADAFAEGVSIKRIKEEMVMPKRKPQKEVQKRKEQNFEKAKPGLEKESADMVEDLIRSKKAGGGLMDLGGKEMDLRGGGFVPIGAKERADDVPARLSKNEFVFTADAVRAAGGGSVEKGAQKMYNTMKQLEESIA